MSPGPIQLNQATALTLMLGPNGSVGIQASVLLQERSFQMSDDRGRFVWYDLMTTDPDAAQSFYTELIGWGTQAWDGPMPYTMWTNHNVPLGGVVTLPEEAKQAGAPPHWLAYIQIPNVDETVTTAEQNQGKVVVPAQDIPKVGRFAGMSRRMLNFG